MYNKQSKIGILGSGTVGQVLAQAFIANGNPVMMGTRNPAKSKLGNWMQENPEVKVGGYEEAALFGDILVLCVAGAVAQEVLEAAGSSNLSGKLVLDTTNPISPGKSPDNGVLHFFTNLDESLMEKLQKMAPEARLVKAFNSVGNTLMYQPKLKDTPTMFICGNHPDAKKDAGRILEAFGWEVCDMGAVEAARAIEPLCMLWCIPGFLHNKWKHAFKLLQ